MNDYVSPVSLYSQYFLSSCYNKNISSKIFTYSAELSKQPSVLNATRESFLEETELVIRNFQNMQSIHQVATKIRHSSLPVQYFIFERALLFSRYEILHKDPPEDFLDTENKSCHMLYALLQLLWDDTVKFLDDSEIDLNTYLSNLIHGHY